MAEKMGKKETTENYVMREMTEIPNHLRRKFIDYQIHDVLGSYHLDQLDYLLQRTLQIKATIDIVAERDNLELYFLICYLDVIASDRKLTSEELMNLDGGYRDGKVFAVAMTTPEVDLGDDSRCLLALVAKKLTEMEDCMATIAQHFAEIKGTFRLARIMKNKEVLEGSTEVPCA